MRVQEVNRIEKVEDRASESKEKTMKFTGTVLLALVGCMPTIELTSAADRGQSVEEIYVARSLRLSRDRPTKNCASERTGFPEVRFEDRYHFQSVRIDTKTGLVTEADVATVGELLACFGPSSDPLITNFYAEGSLGEVKFTGTGECRSAKKDYPEPGLNLFRCFLDITNLPADYVGGHLTTNTVTSKQSIGLTSDPPGYVQPSIATIRLWKKRAPAGN
jgi:hypothetical protein